MNRTIFIVLQVILVSLLWLNFKDRIIPVEYRSLYYISIIILFLLVNGFRRIHIGLTFIPKMSIFSKEYYIEIKKMYTE